MHSTLLEKMRFVSVPRNYPAFCTQLERVQDTTSELRFEDAMTASHGDTNIHLLNCTFKLFSRLMEFKTWMPPDNSIRMLSYVAMVPSLFYFLLNIISIVGDEKNVLGFI